MKSIKNLLFLAASMLVFGTACEKMEDLPLYEKGNVVELTASKTAVVPTAADSTSEVISFSWTDPKYATDTANYKFIVEIDSTGRNFAKKVTREVKGRRSFALTGRDLNAILLGYGFNLGSPYNLDVRVVSSYGNNNEQYTSNVAKISVTPFNDPSKFSGSAANIVLSLANAAQNIETFTWTASFPGYTGTINYVIQYDSAGKNFANAKDLGASSTALTKTLTQGEMNESALQSGVAGGNDAKIEYRVKATTQQGAISFSNAFAVTMKTYLPILRFYLPGGYQGATGNGNDWDPPTAPELIRDVRSSVFNQMYYIYIYLPANAEFKVTQGRSWDVNYGGTGGNLVAGGDNFKVTTAGYYRISINRVTMKYEIREGRMGFVGGATGAGWTPPNVFPTYALGAAATNLFVGLTDFTTGGWKLIDSDTWNDGSNSVGETRSYGAPTGSTMQVNGDNFPDNTTPGRYRVIWDGRDVNNIKYEKSPASEMRVVGNGIDEPGVGEWSPGTSPQMTYTGNGIWTLTLKLKADKEIKFLAGNDWGAFDYEDNSGGSNAVGTARKIKWEGGDNFKTPAVAGTYTITLNEKLQTVTIN
jgi:starch-binding outer membrane protein SusE/F